MGGRGNSTPFEVINGLCPTAALARSPRRSAILRCPAATRASGGTRCDYKLGLERGVVSQRKDSAIIPVGPRMAQFEESGVRRAQARGRGRMGSAKRDG